jgi:predicted secreted hydrolase
MTGLAARWAQCMLSIAAAASLMAATPSYAPVTDDHALTFPADYGSHPQFRTEWWYVTGWLRTRHRRQ